MTANEGDKCAYRDCDGHYVITDPECCSCHINPPCEACVGVHLMCDQCHYAPDEE